MPNWCKNEIKITGDPVLIRNLRSQMYAGIDGNLPQPMNCLPLPEDIGSGWYEWSVKNWGTKWPMQVTKAEFTADEIVLTGDTAWSPPIPLLEHISRLYPGLEIVLTYYEEGVSFAGAAAIYRGESNISEGEIESPPEMDDEDEWMGLYLENLSTQLAAHAAEVQGY